MTLGTGRRASGQNAILDRGLATVLGLVGLIGAMAAYLVEDPNADAQAERSQVAAIGDAVDTLYGRSPDYGGLTGGQVAASGDLPPAWVVPGTAGGQPSIASVFRSRISLAPVDDVLTGIRNGAWTLTIAGVPRAACMALATTPNGPGAYGVSINGVGAPTGPPPPGVDPLPNVAQAAARCGKASNTMAFYLA